MVVIDSLLRVCMVSSIRPVPPVPRETKNKRVVRLPPDPKNKVKKISKKFTTYTKATSTLLKDKKEKQSMLKKKTLKASKKPSLLGGIFQRFLLKFIKKKPSFSKEERKRFIKYKA